MQRTRESWLPADEPPRLAPEGENPHCSHGGAGALRLPLALGADPRTPFRGTGAPLRSLRFSSVTALADYLAQQLSRDAADLGAHWQDRARAAVPRPPDRPPTADLRLAERIVSALAAALPEGGLWQDSLMRAGWQMGAGAHEAGYPADALLTEIELLTAILLYSSERHVDALDVPREVATTPPTETFATIRRLQEATSLLTLAATRGYAHSQQDSQQRRYRTLRHDLRNPIGTIQSAAALMQDPSIPSEQRNDPRYADMVVRNAQSLQQMIASHLGDESADTLTSAQQVSLRDLALAVRRAVRAEAEHAECRVDVDEQLPEVRAAAGGLELTLRSLLAATIAALPLGSAVRITSSQDNGKVRVLLVTHPPLRDTSRVAESASALAAVSGAAVGSGEGMVWAEVPAVAVGQPVEGEAAQPA